MYQCPGGGVQHTQHRESHSQEVDAHGKRNAELNGADCGIGQLFQIGQLGNVVAHQGDVGSLYRNVAAHASHRHSNAGGFQRRGVVHAVPYHTHLVPMGTEIDYLDEITLDRALNDRKKISE